MVKIRLTRIGQKGAPAYRIVASDSHSPRDGRFIEILGTYNPLTKPATVQMDEAKVLAWIKKGAQPTDSVSKIFRTTGFQAKLEAEKAVQ